jgi:DNA-binding response OmpR family regulator
MLKHKCILVVDDDDAIREMLRWRFELAGFGVLEASNGSEAVKAAQTTKPDLVVLDLMMPVMNGLQAARVLKLMKPEVPLVMFTSEGGSDLEQEASESGISAFVPKCGGTDRLLASADCLLGLGDTAHCGPPVGGRNPDPAGAMA